MKVPNFQSSMAPSLRAFVKLRHSLGYGDRGVRSLLAHFDRYLLACGWETSILTRELVQDWASSGGPLQPKSRAQRLHVMRLYGRFLSQTHPDTYIPGPVWVPRQQSIFRPHIYTPAEIQALLREASQLTPAGSLRPRTYVTLFGVLYCTGLRISEALALRLMDVDCDDGLVWVQESKFHKSRVLPLRSDAVAELRLYLSERCSFGHAQDPEAPLFLNQRGGPCTHPLVCATFLAIVRSLGLRGPPGTRGPRLHDLRHTFAVHRLLDWYRDGGNVQARLPLLADYLGHVSLVSTQVYLEITAELLGEAAQRFRPPTLVEPVQHGGLS